MNKDKINNTYDDESNSSINDFDFSLICEYFSSIYRQGPGSDETTRRAMALAGNPDSESTIADIGCGCGSQTLQLALYSGARIKALDLFPLFVEKTISRCNEAGVGDRVEGIVGNMECLPFEDGSMDVLWSEGAIYNIGFQRGMKEWRRFLKKGGYIAVSEAVWLSDSRPSEIESFWNDAYPEIDTVSRKVQQMLDAGYEDVKTFVLPDECWTDNFYIPQLEAQRLFLERYPDSNVAHELVANQRLEAELYSRYHNYYGYVFFVGRKAGG